MKQAIRRRKNYLKNQIFSEQTKTLCRLNEKPKAFTRNRKIKISDILLSTLNKQGRNISFEIRDYEINKKGATSVNYTEEAYLKQRRQLNPEVFKHLNYNYLRDFYHEKKYVKKYKGYVVWAIDGSINEIPNTKENRNKFGIRTWRKKTNGSVARALMLGAYDVYNNFFGDIEIDKSTTYEAKLCKKNIDICVKINDKQKNLFVFDRLYPSIELYEYIIERQAKFVMRLSTNDYVEERKQMKNDDEIIKIEYNRHRKHHFKTKNPEVYEKIKNKEGINLRIINIRLKTGENETLITNILSNKFDIEDFKEIYKKRWKIEEGYNSLKNKLKIEKITGRMPIYIYQDIYAQVLVYNQIQDMMKVANEQLEEKNRIKTLKREYQVNENKAIGLYKEQFIKIMLMENRDEAEKAFDELIEEMIKYVSIIRENREAKRIWNISNKYHSNRGATF